MYKIKKYHNKNVAKIAMLEIRSFVDHSPIPNATFHCCDPQKLSNLACSVKLKDWTLKWDNACVIVVDLDNRRVKFNE